MVSEENSIDLYSTKSKTQKTQGHLPPRWTRLAGAASGLAAVEAWRATTRRAAARTAEAAMAAGRVRRASEAIMEFGWGERGRRGRRKKIFFPVVKQGGEKRRQRRKKKEEKKLSLVFSFFEIRSWLSTQFFDSRAYDDDDQLSVSLCPSRLSRVHQQRQDLANSTNNTSRRRRSIDVVVLFIIDGALSSSPSPSPALQPLPLRFRRPPSSVGGQYARRARPGGPEEGDGGPGGPEAGGRDDGGDAERKSPEAFRGAEGEEFFGILMLLRDVLFLFTVAEV